MSHQDLGDRGYPPLRPTCRDWIPVFQRVKTRYPQRVSFFNMECLWCHNGIGPTDRSEYTYFSTRCCCYWRCRIHAMWPMSSRKISLDEPPNLRRGRYVHIPLCKQFPLVNIRLDLSDSWPYRRVFASTSEFHWKFYTPDKMMLVLIHREHKELDAIRMMQRLTKQHMYILSLKELY